MAAGASGAFDLADEVRRKICFLSRDGMYDGNRCPPNSGEEDSHRKPDQDGPQLKEI
jgi:hypothetical protein